MTDQDERKGDWCQTYTGVRFYPLDPRAEEVRIEDIAHHLALLTRFGGACRKFYSVAEHSVRVSFACAPQDALWGLLHDAAEAYLIDVPRPLKRLLVGYKDHESAVQRSICERFGLGLEQPQSVTIADDVLLVTEGRDLMTQFEPRWALRADPLPEPITPWTWMAAELLFLERFEVLTNEVNTNGRIKNGLPVYEFELGMPTQDRKTPRR